MVYECCISSKQARWLHKELNMRSLGSFSKWQWLEDLVGKPESMKTSCGEWNCGGKKGKCWCKQEIAAAINPWHAVGSGMRYIICITRFARCASQNTQDHERIARVWKRTTAISAIITAMLERLWCSHGSGFLTRAQCCKIWYLWPLLSMQGLPSKR